MKIIKGVLREELANALKMKESYEKALEELPRGALIRKDVKGHLYYYLVVREGKKVNFLYKGKVLPEEEIRKYEEAKKLRAKYRSLLSGLKKEIVFLERALRGK